MKLKSTYYICEVKCLIEIYRNCASEFDRGHGPLKLKSKPRIETKLKTRLFSSSFLQLTVK